MDEKIIIALISVGGGGVLAQVAALGKDRIYREWIKRALIDELMKIRESLDRSWLNYARQLQMHALGGIGNDAVLPIGNFIFTNHYKDAALALNRFQRQALQITHAHIASINEESASLREFVAEVQVKHARGQELDPVDLGLHGRRVRALLHNIALAKWHVRHYLAHPKFPNLDIDTETHESFLKYAAQIDPEIDKIAKSAEGLTRDAFEWPYGVPPESAEDPRDGDKQKAPA